MSNGQSLEHELEDELSSNPIVKALASFGFSAVAGLSAAYFVKKVFKTVMFVVGGFFLSLQIMAYKKLITIHWDNWLPKFSLGKVVRMLTFGSAGFGVGFYFGIKNEVHKMF
mmetsp:Transcript_12579/g.10791  ORF Transcript_12579/g.10791 Transcript_12579/m.10791 type:complete len:112 (-) Transcript_12579:103-438(-)